jgi:predicted 2-oxoglutarate/Fe(II)-dependent dioxygenase YbiX
MAKKKPANRSGEWTLIKHTEQNETAGPLDADQGQSITRDRAQDRKSSDSVAWMTTAIEQAARSQMFCTSGTLSPIDPGLEVVRVGPVRLPLKPAMAKSLITAARIAPFGKGTETLVDTKVRKTFEIDASQIRLSAAWEKAIEEIVTEVATALGLADQQLRAELYKLLLYERGGHFQRHRDSEKINRMVGSLIVMLPSAFSGGELVIQHESQRETFRFENARAESSPDYVAFYADCEHEVLRVDTGRRLCLTYNLIVGNPSAATKKKTSADVDDATRLANAIKA